MLRKIKGKFLMTLNDCDAVRQIFSNCTIETVQAGYFIANARDTKNARPRTSQLLIHNRR